MIDVVLFRIEREKEIKNIIDGMEESNVLHMNDISSKVCQVLWILRSLYQNYEWQDLDSFLAFCYLIFIAADFRIFCDKLAFWLLLYLRGLAAIFQTNSAGWSVMQEKHSNFELSVAVLNTVLDSFLCL